MGKLQIGKRYIRIEEEWTSYDNLPPQLKDNVEKELTKIGLKEVGYEFVSNPTKLNNSSFP